MFQYRPTGKSFVHRTPSPQWRFEKAKTQTGSWIYFSDSDDVPKINYRLAYSTGTDLDPRMKPKNPLQLNREVHPIAFGKGELTPTQSQKSVVKVHVDDCRYNSAYGCQRNSVCKNAGIGSLVVYGFDPQIAETNICALPVSKIHPAAMKTIQQIGDINQKVATLLGMKVTDLFYQGVDLTLMMDPFGVLGSFVSTEERRVTMSLYPSWIQQGEIEPGVYAHELGHLLSMDEPTALAPNPLIKNIHPTLKAIAKNILFMETLADTFAFGSYGGLMGNPEDPINCDSGLRRITGVQSYNYPRAYFDVNFSNRRAEACCAYDLKHGIQSDYSKYYCKICIS